MRAPGGCGSDSHHEASVRLPPCLESSVSPDRGALPYFQNCCSEALEIGMLFMTKPIPSKLLFGFKNI